MKKTFKILACTVLIAALGAGIWRGGSAVEYDFESQSLGWLAGLAPWMDDIEFEVKDNRQPYIQPISTMEEFLRISGDHAFYDVEVGVRWDRSKIPEFIHVDFKCADDHDRAYSEGQIVKLLRKRGRLDSKGMAWYTPEKRIVIVSSAEFEIVAEDRVGIYFREGGQWSVSFID
jgi:hypothetical protein